MTDTYRIRSPETWDRAREAYLAGEPAEGVCSRFDIGIRAFRDRAAKEGWRRADQPDPEPFELDDDADLDVEIDDAELRRLARNRMARAARQGLVGEALRWARLGEHIDRQRQMRLREERDLADQDSRLGQSKLLDALSAARALKDAADAVRVLRSDDRTSENPHDLHHLHPDSDRADPEDLEEPPQNRADRRRQLKQGRKRR